MPPSRESPATGRRSPTEPRMSAKRGPPHDPDLLIAQVLAMGSEFVGPAEDIIFS